MNATTAALGVAALAVWLMATSMLLHVAPVTDAPDTGERRRVTVSSRFGRTAAP